MEGTHKFYRFFLYNVRKCSSRSWRLQLRFLHMLSPASRLWRGFRPSTSHACTQARAWSGVNHTCQLRPSAFGPFRPFPFLSPPSPATHARAHTHLPLHLLRPPCSALPRSVAQMGLKKQQRLRPWGRPLGRYQTASPLPTPPRAHPFFFFCTPSPPPPTSEVSGNVVLRRRAW